jgi:hypothetical protein
MWVLFRNGSALDDASDICELHVKPVALEINRKMLFGKGYFGM